MNPDQADRLIFTSALITLGSTTAASILPDKYGGHGELPKARLVFGTSLAFIGLSMLGDFAPSFAGPLAFVLAMSALSYYGLPVMDAYFSGKPIDPNTRPKPTY